MSPEIQEKVSYLFDQKHPGTEQQQQKVPDQKLQRRKGKK